MGEINRALGRGSSIEFKGKTYSLSPWTYGIQGDFEKHMEGEAIKSAKKMRPYLAREEYMELLKEVQRDITCGVYSFGSQTLGKALDSLPHFKVLLLLMLTVSQPDTTMALVDDLVNEKLEEVMQKMTEANADPSKATNPAATTVTATATA